MLRSIAPPTIAASLLAAILLPFAASAGRRRGRRIHADLQRQRPDRLGGRAGLLVGPRRGDHRRNHRRKSRSTIPPISSGAAASRPISNSAPPTAFRARAATRASTSAARNCPTGTSRATRPTWKWGPTARGTLYECNQRGSHDRARPEGGDRRGRQTQGHARLAPAAELQKLIKPNDWNEYVIIARGPEIILKINGAVTSHVDRPREGQGRRQRADHPPTPSRPRP